MCLSGRVNSFQSLGAVDGPGVRFVVFTQGCPLRCKYCHNPETWDYSKGFSVTPAEIVKKAERYREYYGEKGGITISGGEPLAQPEFVKGILKLARTEKINTALDTSGCIYNEAVRELLPLCDLVLLDLKFNTVREYKEHCGLEGDAVFNVLDELERQSIPTEIRRVIVPGLNDSEEDMLTLCGMLKGRKNIKKIKLLPFKNICKEKYSALGIRFPLEGIETAPPELMAELQALVDRNTPSNDNK